MASTNIENVFDRAKDQIRVPGSGEAHDVLRDTLNDTYQLGNVARTGFQPKIVWDVGAGWGTVSWLICHLWPQSIVLAFEPDTTRFKWLTKNADDINHNPDAGTVIPFQLCLLGHIAPRVSTDPVHRPREWDYLKLFPEHVRCRLGTFLGHRIDLLKLDIEGAEFGILRDLFGLNLLRQIPHVVGKWYFEQARQAVRGYLSPSHEVEIRDSGPWNLFFARQRQPSDPSRQRVVVRVNPLRAQK